MTASPTGERAAPPAERPATTISSVSQGVKDSLHKALVDRAPDLAFVTSDRVGRIVSWSAGAERLLGWSEAEVQGRPASDILSPEGAAGSAEEGWLPCKNGGRTWILRGTSPLFEADGGPPVGEVTILCDRTARQAAADETDVLRSVILASDDCIVVLDLDGHTLFVSPGGIRSMEISDVEAILGLSWLRVWTGADNEAARTAVREAAAGGTGRFQGFCPTHKGTPKWWDVVISPVPGPDGRPQRLVSVGRDITEQVRTKDRLTLSEAALRMATDAAEVGTWDLDLETNLLTWSDRTKAMFGISAHVPCSMDDFYAGLHPDDLDHTSAAFASALDPARRATYDVEYRVRGKEDGVLRWVAAKGRGLFDAEGRCMRAVGTAIDISDRKSRESRQQFLLMIADRLRESTEPGEIMTLAVEALGRHLKASRIGYGQVQADGETIVLDTSYADGVEPLTGAFALDGFGADTVARQRQGLTVVERDVAAAPMNNPATWAAIETRSFVSVPLIRDGRLRAALYVNQREPRAWSAGEIALIEDVAARTWDAVERARAEVASRESAQLLRVAQEAGGIGAFEWHPDTGRMIVSDQYRRIWGFAPGVEVTADLLMAQIHPDDRRRAAPARIATHENPLEYAEYRMRRHDTGKERWVARRGEVMQTSDGTRRFFGVAFDVTDQKHADSRFRGVFNSELTGLVLFDAETDETLAVNDCFLTMTGHTREEFEEGRWGWRQFVSRDGSKIAEAAVAEARQRGRWDPFETECRRRDGSSFAVRVSSAPLPGEPGRVVISISDITEERAAEAAIRESEEHYRHAAELNPQVSWTAAPDGQLDRVADHWRQWTGTSGLGDSWGRGLHPDDLGYTVEAWTTSVTTGVPYDVEHRFKMVSGKFRWARSRAFARRDDGGSILRWYGTTEDIHERKEAEEHRTLLINELNHRVKNTLATVQSVMHQTLRSVSSPDEARRVLDARIQSLSNAQNVLTRENWRGATLSDVVAEALRPFQVEGGRRFDVGGPSVRLRPGVALAIAMALHELSTNAVKYGALSNDTGRVRLGWDIGLGGASDRLRLTWEEAGGPPVNRPMRTGFGTRMIERALAAELDGCVRLDYRPAGIVFTAEAPLSEVREDDAAPGQPIPA